MRLMISRGLKRQQPEAQRHQQFDGQRSNPPALLVPRRCKGSTKIGHDIQPMMTVARQQKEDAAEKVDPYLGPRRYIP